MGLRFRKVGRMKLSREGRWFSPLRGGLLRLASDGVETDPWFNWIFTPLGLASGSLLPARIQSVLTPAREDRPIPCGRAEGRLIHRGKAT